MSTIVKGIYRNGQVRLLETPEGVEGGAPYPTRDELHNRGR